MEIFTEPIKPSEIVYLAFSGPNGVAKSQLSGRSWFCGNGVYLDLWGIGTSGQINTKESE